MEDCLYKKYQDLFDENEGLLKITDKQLAFIAGKKPTNDLQSISIFLWCRATVTMQAIQVLCKEGFGEDALALVRCLFEILVTLRYIKNNPQRRGKRFFQFSVIQEKEYSERYVKAGIGEVTEENLKEINTAYEKTKNIFGPKDINWTDFITILKRNHSIKEMAEETNMTWDYDFVYYSLSHLFIHTSPRGTMKYTMESLDGGIIPVLRPGDRQTRESLSLSQRYFAGILKDFNGIWGSNVEIKAQFLC